VTRVTSRDELTAERYNVGYVDDDGEFQPVVDEDQRSRPETLIAGQHQRITESFDRDEQIALRNPQNDEILDISDISGKDTSSYEQRREDNRQDVLNT